MNDNTAGQEPAPEKPCLVKAAQGFSVFYKNRFLYSKYAPERSISLLIENLTILPGTLIIASSPVLWIGLESLLEKIGEDCCILGVETDPNLYEFAKTQLDEFKSKNKGKKCDKIHLLPIDETDFIVNVLYGEGKNRSGKNPLPHISTFRRAIPLEMSAGTQFDRENYAKITSLAQNAILSFWKNRITLTKLGRLYSRNLFKNLKTLPKAVDFRELIHSVENPILVFGAGESIEETIKSLGKEKIEKKFVISVDAAIPTLKAYGIRADAVVAVEGQVAIEKSYIGGGAADSLLICDILSRQEVTTHTKKAITYFASKYTDSHFLKELSEKYFFPPLVPPLGSVGLTAVFIATKLRKNPEIPIFINGLDFSFSLGRTHAKNTSTHIARLSNCGRFSPAENYEAAFKNGAKKAIGKNGIEVFTDTALESYAKSFEDFFSETKNLYDLGKNGLNLGISQNLKTVLNQQTKEKTDFLSVPQKNAAENNSRAIKNYLENEEKALNRIKELLVYGKDVESCSENIDTELYKLISCREYLFLHFPDGYKCKTSDLSFLKRIRGQLDFFLKDIKGALSELSEDF